MKTFAARAALTHPPQEIAIPDAGAPGTTHHLTEAIPPGKANSGRKWRETAPGVPQLNAVENHSILLRYGRSRPMMSWTSRRCGTAIAAARSAPRRRMPSI